MVVLTAFAAEHAVLPDLLTRLQEQNSEVEKEIDDKLTVLESETRRQSGVLRQLNNQLMHLLRIRNSKIRAEYV